MKNNHKWVKSAKGKNIKCLFVTKIWLFIINITNSLFISIFILYCSFTRCYDLNQHAVINSLSFLLIALNMFNTIFTLLLYFNLVSKTQFSENSHCERFKMLQAVVNKCPFLCIFTKFNLFSKKYVNNQHCRLLKLIFYSLWSNTWNCFK